TASCPALQRLLATCIPATSFSNSSVTLHSIAVRHWARYRPPVASHHSNLDALPRHIHAQLRIGPAQPQSLPARCGTRESLLVDPGARQTPIHHLAGDGPDHRSDKDVV